METTLEVSTQVPVLTVRFDPNNLPEGAVDQEDFAQFLDGMRLALDGLVAYDANNGLFAEVGARPHLTIANIRRSSVECDIFINFFINISVNWQLIVTMGVMGAAGAVGTGLALRAIIKRAVSEAATDAAKAGIEKAAQSAGDQARHLTTRFMDAMKSAISGHRDTEHRGLPPEQMLHLLPGLRKMARVGAKGAYGEKGVTVADSADQNGEVAFNGEAKRIIEIHAKEALASHEPVNLVGTIEQPNSSKRRFVLHLHSQARRIQTIPCYYQTQHEDMVRAVYAERAFVRVTGEKRFRYYSNPSKPRAIVNVSTIEYTIPDDLWSSHIA